MVHLELFSDRFLHGFLYELGFEGGCGSGGKVVHLELVKMVKRGEKMVKNAEKC